METSGRRFFRKMSVKQSRNVDSSSGSECEVDGYYSEEIKSRVAHFNHHASEIATQIDDLIAGTPTRRRNRFLLAGCDVIEHLRRQFVDRMER